MSILIQDNTVAYLFPLDMLLSMHDRLDGFSVSRSDRATEPRLKLLWQPKLDPRSWCPDKIEYLRQDLAVVRRAVSAD